MYQNTHPLNKDQDLIYTQINTYTFAARENFCPVFLQELPQVIREYFVCFPNNETDLPHALLGFQKDTNQYVTADGTWQADYIPAYIRRYPFILASVEGDGKPADEFTLAADMAAPHFEQPDGQPLFTQTGQPTDLLEQRISLLKGIEHQRTATQQAVREIEAAGLFKVEQLTIKRKDQPLATIDGLRMIAPEKLSQITTKLGPVAELIYAHLFSKTNMQYGVLAGKRKDVAAAPAPADPGFGMGDDDIIRFH